MKPRLTFELSESNHSEMWREEPLGYFWVERDGERIQLAVPIRSRIAAAYFAGATRRFEGLEVGMIELVRNSGLPEEADGDIDAVKKYLKNLNHQAKTRGDSS